MGFTADRRGLVPNSDVEKVAEVGQRIKRCYGKALAQVSSKLLSDPQGYISLQIDTGKAIDRVWIREDISSGQRAQQFSVHAQMDAAGDFVLVGNGTSIGHKRIVVFREEIKPVALRVQVTASLDWPVPIREFAAFASCSNFEKQTLV